MQDSTNFTYTNPRFIDGEPDEVAAKAATQALRVANLHASALSDTWVLARNSALSDYHKAHDAMPDDVEEWWKQQPLAKTLLAASRALNLSISKLSAAETALSFDPDAPLDELSE